MPLAIVLPLTTEAKERLKGSKVVSLTYEGKTVGIIRDAEFFPHRKDERIARQFGTSSPNHPYIKVRQFYHRPHLFFHGPIL